MCYLFTAVAYINSFTDLTRYIMQGNTLLEKLKQKKRVRAAQFAGGTGGSTSGSLAGILEKATNANGAQANMPVLQVQRAPVPVSGPRQIYVIFKTPGEKLGMGISSQCEIESVVASSPSARACLQTGVKVIEVNGTPVMSMDEVKRLFIQHSNEQLMQLTLVTGSTGVVPEPQNMRTAQLQQQQQQQPQVPPQPAMTPPPTHNTVPPHQVHHAPPQYSSVPPQPGSVPPQAPPVMPTAPSGLPASGPSMSNDELFQLIDKVVADAAAAPDTRQFEDSLRRQPGNWGFLNAGHQFYEFYISRRDAKIAELADAHQAIASAFADVGQPAPPQHPVSHQPMAPDPSMSTQELSEMQMQFPGAFAAAGVMPSNPMTAVRMVSMQRNVPKTAFSNASESGLEAANRLANTSRRSEVGTHIGHSTARNRRSSSRSSYSSYTSDSSYSSDSRRKSKRGRHSGRDTRVLKKQQPVQDTRRVVTNSPAIAKPQPRSKVSAPIKLVTPALPPDDYVCPVCSTSGHWGSECTIVKNLEGMTSQLSFVIVTYHIKYCHGSVCITSKKKNRN